MRLYFLKDFDGHKEGESKFVELSLGRRYVENGIAITYAAHLENVARKEEEAKEQKAKELAAKKKAAAPRKRATSKRATTRKKAVKPDSK